MANSITLATSAGNSSSEAAGAMRIWLISLAVTAVAALESWPKWPWAPFLFLHGMLAIAIPLKSRCLGRINFLHTLKQRRRLIAVGFLVGIAYIALFSLAVTLWLTPAGQLHNTQWNSLAAYKEIYHRGTNRWGEPAMAILLFLFVVPWAGFVEEIFYRGFTYAGMRLQIGSLRAAVVSNILFGLRHSAQLMYLWPAYPIGAGMMYFAFSALAGILFSVVYERAGSFWAGACIHFLVNLVSFPVLFYILHGP